MSINEKVSCSRVRTQPGKSGKVMEFDLGTWKLIDPIEHLESHGISFKCDE